MRRVTAAALRRERSSRGGGWKAGRAGGEAGVCRGFLTVRENLAPDEDPVEVALGAAVGDVAAGRGERGPGRDLRAAGGEVWGRSGKWQEQQR